MSNGTERTQISGRIVAAAWILAAALSFFGVGSYVQDLVTGIVPQQRAHAGALLAVIATLAALVATVLWARGLGRSRATQGSSAGLGAGTDAFGRAESGTEAAAGTIDGEAPITGRRRFLTGAATATGGLLATGAAGIALPHRWITVTGRAIGPEVPNQDPNPREDWKGSRIQSYRRLGRTGFEVSDISLGSGRIKGELGEQIAREAIERGVNYFDTAPDYSEEGSELALGKAMKGHRDKMFLATKFCTPQGHLQAGASVDEYKTVVEDSLRRLQTDHVDLVHVHACDTVERIKDPHLHEAFEQLKKEGKARFLGFSSHTPNLENVANTAIDDGRFDVMMLAYHHGAWPKLGDIIARAHQKDVAVVAMKTLKGAKHRGLLELRPEADSYSQAAFKWVLGNSNVSCLVISFFDPQHVDEYLYASGKTLSESDLALLQKYDRLIAGKHCFPHCGACLDSCPEELQIADVLRYRMYFEDYGDQKGAMQKYARLAKKADVCAGCPAPCTNACPHGVPIRERMMGAHEMLSMG